MSPKVAKTVHPEAAASKHQDAQQQQHQRQKQQRQLGKHEAYTTARSSRAVVAFYGSAAQLGHLYMANTMDVALLLNVALPTELLH